MQYFLQFSYCLIYLTRRFFFIYRPHRGRCNKTIVREWK